ncbi:Multicopper oxidase, N-terminal [Dillenia turbinata]|uniref:Multicopper oxidase, N-terminal n=1 Tax=Dillenia turbinata TaxID=194707 RepID=A0AAN8ZJG1_9MAGN
MGMFWRSVLLLLGLNIALLFVNCFGADPFVQYLLKVSYITASPLGTPQQVIAVNEKFPGSVINVTTNYNLEINVVNGSGIQMRKNSWQDGVLGTNCPIPPKYNWTYRFQVKDQIGSFFYFPSLNLQRASGGFGPFIVNNRDIIPIPFAAPDGDIVIMIGDWYTRNHSALQADLDAGKDLGMPDGVLINGKGPFQYNSTLVPSGIDYEIIHVDPGKTYRVRVHNVGLLTRNGPPVTINGKLRATLNGISFVNLTTPIRLADQHNQEGVYKLDFPNTPLIESPKMDRSVINATYKGFIEIVFQNNDTVMQSYHLDGYSFFVVGMNYGNWTEDSRGTYNKWDAISRSTVQVYPGAWTAVYVSLDNPGAWNLRAENLDRWYLGQETYLRIVNPQENNSTEMVAPENVRYCGVLAYLQHDAEPYDDKAAASIVIGRPQIFFSLLGLLSFLMLITR